MPLAHAHPVTETLPRLEPRGAGEPSYAPVEIGGGTSRAFLDKVGDVFGRR